MEPASLTQTQTKLAMSRNEQTALAELWLNPTEAEINDYCNQVSVPDALTLSQFEELESHFTDTVMTRERIAEDFRILDTDNDGKLTKQEVREVLKLASEVEDGEVEMDDDTFELFYNDFDIKKQGYLTEEEFIDAMQLLRENLGEDTRAIWKKLKMPDRDPLITQELRELLVKKRLHMLLKYGELPLLPCEVHELLTNPELRRQMSPDLMRRLLQHPQLFEILTHDELRELLNSDEARAILSEEEIQKMLLEKEIFDVPRTEATERVAIIVGWEEDNTKHVAKAEELRKKLQKSRELKPQKKKTGCCG